MFLTAIIAASISLPGPHSTAATSAWNTQRQASWYGYGGRTACGRAMRPGAIWVAALKDSLAHCGARITICHGYRCYKVQVEDRGANRYDRRDWDLTPGLKYNLRCGDLCTVKWRHGW